MKRSILCLILLALLLCACGAPAAPSATEAPKPTARPVATEQPTPTPELTPEPSPEATPEPAPEPTPEPLTIPDITDAPESLTDVDFAAPYASVSFFHLQGSWYNAYYDDGHFYEELVTVNGDHGMVRSFEDGQPTFAWNGSGTVELEDRSERGKCPAFRINDADGSNICTIYISAVEAERFYDAGFNYWWVRTDDGDTWLYDTVTENTLQGLWYGCEQKEDGCTITALLIEDDQALLEVYSGSMAPENLVTKALGSFTIQHIAGSSEAPLLLIRVEDGTDVGIYISEVDDNRLYDPWHNSWMTRLG